MRIPTERIECINLMKWARLMKLPLIHISNEGKRTPWGGADLKAQGLTPGVSDFFLARASRGYHGLWIEMKRRKGGILTQLQEEWLQKMHLEGYCTSVCYGWSHAKECIEHYLNIVPRETI